MIKIKFKINKMFIYIFILYYVLKITSFNKTYIKFVYYKLIDYHCEFLLNYLFPISLREKHYKKHFNYDCCFYQNMLRYAFWKGNIKSYMILQKTNQSYTNYGKLLKLANRHNNILFLHNLLTIMPYYSIIYFIKNNYIIHKNIIYKFLTKDYLIYQLCDINDINMYISNMYTKLIIYF
jgi:hypothetical protein